MISGHQALASVENAIVDLRRNEDQLEVALQSATEEATRLRQDLVEGYKALARVRLDAIASDSVNGKLDTTEQRVKELLAKRSSALNDEARKRGRAFDAVTAALAKRHGASEAFDAAVQALDEMRAKTQARILADSRWAALNQTVDSAADIVTAAQKKAADSQQDLAVKRLPYEGDALFMYLWQRGFGTARYGSTGLTRFFDRQVAAFIGFDHARTNFALLQEMPVRLAEHAERCKIKGADALKARTLYEREALEADGVVALEKQAARAQGEVETSEASLKAAREALAQFDQTRAGSAGGNDAGYQQALKMLTDAIAHEDLRTLYKEALQTPTTDDEEIVRRLQGLSEAIERADKDVASTRETMRQASKRRTDMEDARDDFQRKGYNDPNVGFRNDSIIAEMLGGIVRGVLQGTQLGSVLHDGYTRQQPRSNPWFGGGGYSGGNYSGGMGGGSVWGNGGGSGSGGGSSGGNDDGFTTGGSF